MPPLDAIARDLVRDIDYLDELRRTSRTPEQYEARAQNVEAVINALATYAAAAEHPRLHAFLDATHLNSDSQVESRQDTKRDGVSLMTIHSAKGLEFPFVFIVGLEDGSLPHERGITDGALDEERRLFYVALTRGKRHVTLFEALSRTCRGRERLCKTSRFLAEIPSGRSCARSAPSAKW